ncbi:MAG TPA: hypothetical protein VG267_15790 [Terracidiphilus sp.]|jgi:hypothetical protein|nr:hypothetical protein [Terracidiphilus sp.]
MSNGLDLLMLVCASVGSMAFGVLMAYWIFRAGFALLKPRRRVAAVKAQTELAV